MQVDTLEAPIGRSLEDLSSKVQGRGAVWLDSGPGDGGLVSWDPVGTVEPGPGWPARARALLEGGPRRELFSGGLVGAIGYEAGGAFESMPGPRGELLLPSVTLRRYEGAVHLRDGRWLATGSPAFRAEAAALVRSLEPAPPPEVPGARVVERGDPQAFLEGVRRLLGHIAEGDCYQANLARRLVVEGLERPLDLYRRLRRRPARWGAWMELEEGALLSNSPELFLRRRGRDVESRPIKGTRPLGQAEELLEDPKERAELTMIVDLVRNDLGRVCEPGSVCAGPRSVRPLPTLLHAEQAVSGRLRGDVDALDLLAATFPPGSVTGAPKVQAMRRIHELELSPRGLYTGAIGWFDDGGDLELSVAIRIAQIRRGRGWIHVGCGVVADSEPQRELEESELKFEAWRQALR